MQTINRVCSEETKEKLRQLAIKKNPINTNYFKKLNKRSAYALGYLFADAHFRRRELHYKHSMKFKVVYGLCFSSIDKELIDKIKKEFCIEHRKTGIKPRKDKKRKTTYIIYISNYHFLQYLIKQGMFIGRKADRIEIPKAICKNKSFFFAFFRGFFDGDGTVNSILYTKYIGIAIYTASYNFLVQIKKLMQKYGIHSNFIKKSKTSKTINFSFDGKQNIYKLYKLMYKSSNNLYLSRKKNRFDEFFKAYGWRLV